MNEQSKINIRLFEKLERGKTKYEALYEKYHALKSNIL